jgi:hypothetical protein
VAQIDLARRLAWIHPDQAKARKAIPVPLNAEAVALISTQVGKHLTHVSSFRGKPIIQVSTKGWYAALERPEFLIIGDTTCGTPGQAGTCRTARHSLRCRS